MSFFSPPLKVKHVPAQPSEPPANAPRLEGPDLRRFPVYFEAGPESVPVVFTRNVYGQRVFLDPKDYNITVAHIETGDWENQHEHVYAECFRDGKGGHYIDIGANVGLHVLRAHRHGASVISAFEPNPNTFEILKMNMKLNGAFFGYCHTALGEKEGKIGLNMGVSAGMCSVAEDANLLQVPITTLTNHFERRDRDEKFEGEKPREYELRQKARTAPLKLIKIDVEGHEGEVLSGAMPYLKRFEGFTLILEFGSRSSREGVEEFLDVFDCDIWRHKWQREPESVVREQFKDLPGCDLVFKNVRRK